LKKRHEYQDIPYSKLQTQHYRPVYHGDDGIEDIRVEPNDESLECLHGRSGCLGILVCGAVPHGGCAPQGGCARGGEDVPRKLLHGDAQQRRSLLGPSWPGKLTLVVVS